MPQLLKESPLIAVPRYRKKQMSRWTKVIVFKNLLFLRNFLGNDY